MEMMSGQKLRDGLLKSLGRTNPFALPRIDRVIVNVGVGKRVVAGGKKVLEPLVKDLARITGQQPVVRPARKSVASFKLREGVAAGLMVTLRGKAADDFLTRLIRLILPRMRDFRGIPLRSIDEGGNLTIGIPEQTVFPETDEEPTGISFGFEITIVTTAQNREEAETLFRLMGFPLQSPEA